MESFDGGRKNSMADSLGNGGNNSSIAESIANEGWSKSSMADAIENGGSKSPMADSLEIERGSNSSMAGSLGNEGESNSSIAESIANGGSKSSMADGIENGGSNSSMADSLGNGGSRSAMADSIENEGETKSAMADSIENEGEGKRSMADSIENEESKSLEKNSCPNCLSSGPCRYRPAEQKKPLLVYSSVCEDVGKQKQRRHTEGHQTGTTSMRVDENQETQVLKQDTTPWHCFLGSSLCYGGPDEYYDSLNGRKQEMNKIRTEVRKLEDAANPSNLEYTTRGNWWKGKVNCATE